MALTLDESLYLIAKPMIQKTGILVANSSALNPALVHSAGTAFGLIARHPDRYCAVTVHS